MKVSQMREGAEKVTTEDGVTLRCPICSVPWMKEVEGEFEHGECEHLRFIWWANSIADTPQYFGVWPKEEFETQCITTLNQDLGRIYADEPIDEICGVNDPDLCREVLIALSTPEIDSIWEYEYEEDSSPCGGDAASGFFGLKASPSPM